MRNLLNFLFLSSIFIISCRDKEPIVTDIDLTDIAYTPSKYTPVFPASFPELEEPEDNPMTTDGVLLGRNLFYDNILSADSTMSCGSCHFQEFSFTDNLAVSEGIDAIAGTRSSMSLLNIGFYYEGLFWDGRTTTLEEQALIPVEDPIELHHTWPELIDKLQVHPSYPELFRKAFGISFSSEITKELAAKAIAQFERSIVSSTSSKYDRVEDGSDSFTDEELLGRDLFFDENPDVPDAECGHCHAPPLFTTNEYFNNGIEQVETLDDFPDLGRGLVTDRFDNGKFRVPTLRNIEFTAPYMHDGRFSTLEEVLDHYNSGGHPALNVDQNIRPLNLNQEQLDAILAFMKTLSDTEFLNNQIYSEPF